MSAGEEDGAAPASRMHGVAARGYGAAADTYERSRPDYPADAVAHLAATLGLRPGVRVLEIGAGTGKFTRQLAGTGATIVAVEPVEAMRAVLAGVVPDVEILDGTAEMLPLPNASVDAVVVAQAFHWFDAVRALSEIHRVLRPGGHLALVWNLRDTDVPWSRAVGEIANRDSGATPKARDHAWRTWTDRSALFTPLAAAQFTHAVPTDRAGVLDWVASLSHVAAMDEGPRRVLLAEVEALLRDHPDTRGLDTLDLRYRTDVFWAERRGEAPGREGIVASVNTSPAGVPKRPVHGARVHRLGVEGDGHTYAGHGGEDAAVCLLAQEAIERMRGDGHELFTGAVGENLTLLGLDWGALRAGDRLVFGGGLELQLTEYATPCQTIAHWFVKRRIARIGQKTNSQDARWYARVRTEGTVAPGDTVRLAPQPSPA